MSQPAHLEKNLTTFKSFHPASFMAQSSIHRSLCQNSLFDGKDKIAGGTPTEGGNRHTPSPAATHAPTPDVLPVVALLVLFGFTNSSVIRYIEDDF